jgi:hypothetical protein
MGVWDKVAHNRVLEFWSRESGVCCSDAVARSLDIKFVVACA